MEHEIWKDIKGYEGYYQVSNLGMVRSLEFGKHRSYKKKVNIKPLSVLKNNMGYCFVNLYSRKNKGAKHFLIHRLVAEAFIPNPEGKPFVDHINTNPLDNRAVNLRWVTAKENSNNHLTKSHLRFGCRNNGAPEWALEKAHTATRKAVKMIDLKDGSTLRMFDSISEACRSTNIHTQSICGVCSGKRKSAGGYGWKYCERQIEKTQSYGT